MATIYDIAKELNLSPATVSRVLNNVDHPVSGRTRERILQAAREMDYRPNIIAKSLTKGKTQTIAILLPSITNDFYTQFVDIVENHISEAGFSTILCNTHRSIEKETKFVGTLIERRVDGVVFCPTRICAEDNRQNKRNLEQLCRGGIPVVAIGSHFSGVSMVYADTYEGSRMATDYLLSLGHRAIAFIDGLPAGTSRRRFHGYAEALRRKGIEPRGEWIRCGDLTYESGVRCARELFKAVRPTAVLAANNQMAVGVLNEALAQGLDVPGELSVIGFEDSPISRFVRPTLTVVRQPLDEIGESVKRLLNDLVLKKGGPETVRLLPELVLRESAGRPI